MIRNHGVAAFLVAALACFVPTVALAQSATAIPLGGFVATRRASTRPNGRCRVARVGGMLNGCARLLEERGAALR